MTPRPVHAPCERAASHRAERAAFLQIDVLRLTYAELDIACPRKPVREFRNPRGCAVVDLVIVVHEIPDGRGNRAFFGTACGGCEFLRWPGLQRPARRGATRTVSNSRMAIR